MRWSSDPLPGPSSGEPAADDPTEVLGGVPAVLRPALLTGETAREPDARGPVLFPGQSAPARACANWAAYRRA
jgi:hypothetical protein